MPAFCVHTAFLPNQTQRLFTPLSSPPSLLQGRICCKLFSSILPICDDVISRISSKTVHFATYDCTVKEVLCDHSSVASFPSNKGHSPRHFSWPNLAQFQAFTGSKHRARIFTLFHRNRFQGIYFASLTVRYDNPIPTRFLAPIDCLKFPTL